MLNGLSSFMEKSTQNVLNARVQLEVVFRFTFPRLRFLPFALRPQFSFLATSVLFLVINHLS